jgi:hypothetical protein
VIVETLDDALRHRRDEVANAAAKKFHPSVRAVLESKNGREAAIIGSCILLRIKGRNFAVTAAHVVDRANSNAIYVAGGISSQPAQLLGIVRATAMPPKGRDADKMDLAFWEIDRAGVDKLGSVSFIETANLSHNRVTTENRLYMAMGYPISRNRRNVDRVKRSIRPSLSKYTGELVKGLTIAKKFGVSGDLHLFLKYQKFSETKTGEKRKTFRPNGLSGGAIVDLGNFGAPDRYAGEARNAGYIAGMIIERIERPSTVVAIKIRVIVDAISAHYA